KKLNVNYNIYRAGATGGTNSIQEYSWMPRNSSRWLQTVERFSTISSDTGINNNFQIFLFFLDTQLHRLFASVSNGVSSDGKSQYLNFQKLVSKIVVTLQPRSLKQIEPMGVFNLGTFFLTIITSVPSDRWADMCDKVVSSDRSILH